LYELIAKRTQWPDYKHKITFITDGNEQNENAMLKFFNRDCICYVQFVKIKDNNGRIIGKVARSIIGSMPRDEIGMNNIDGFCSKLRARIGCFVRKTRNFAKRRNQITNLLYITQTNHNFVEAENGETPAMREKLTNKIWSWNDIFNMRLSINI